MVCCEAQNQSKEVVRIAEDLCHESPVIVFAEKKMVLEFTAKSADLWQKRPVDALSYKEAQRQIASKDRGILVLDFGESIGADPRF